MNICRLPLFVGSLALVFTASSWAVDNRVEVDFAANPETALSKFIDGSKNMGAVPGGVGLTSNEEPVMTLVYTEGAAIDTELFGGPGTVTTISLDFVVNAGWAPVGLFFGNANLYFFVDAGEKDKKDQEKLFFGITEDMQYNLGRAGISGKLIGDVYTQGRPGRLEFVITNDGNKVILDAVIYNDGVKVFSHSEDISKGGLEAKSIGIKGYAAQTGNVFTKLFADSAAR